MNDVIDLNFRPATYFRPQRLENYLLSKVKGSVLKRELQALFSEGRHAEAMRFLGDTGISARDRDALESWHPMFLGGNYLPDTDEGEVEIARISISSTTGDVTCVYARPDEGIIRYRVIDEYEGDTLKGDGEMDSHEPLTLGEMTDFFLNTWPFFKVLKMNFFDDLEGRLKFFRSNSDFYPDFDRLCRQRVVADFCRGNSKKTEWRPVTAHMERGTLCVVTEGEDVAAGVSAGQVVRFIRAPVPGSSKAIFQFGPGEYAYSSSDGMWVGKENAHYCCLIDRTRLRLLEDWENKDSIGF